MEGFLDRQKRGQYVSEAAEKPADWSVQGSLNLGDRLAVTLCSRARLRVVVWTLHTFLPGQECQHMSSSACTNAQMSLNYLQSIDASQVILCFHVYNLHRQILRKEVILSATMKSFFA